jgi:hypothetical protein
MHTASWYSRRASLTDEVGGKGVLYGMYVLSFGVLEAAAQGMGFVEHMPKSVATVTLGIRPYTRCHPRGQRTRGARVHDTYLYDGRGTEAGADDARSRAHAYASTGFWE